MTAPQIGTWQRVTSGPQRGATGVVDNIRDFPTGTFYRLVDPITKVVVGRFKDEQLESTAAPAYQSQVTPETRQRAFDLLTGGKVKA
jgi:hypothetical protein